MDWKKIGMALGTGAALVTAGLIGAAISNPEPVVVSHEVPVVVEKTVVQTVEKEVIVEVEVEKLVEVEDEEFLKLACDRLMYEDIVECKEEVSAEDAALKTALELINDKPVLFDFLEDEGLIVDEKEARLIKVYNDFEDIVISESDFDDEEYKFEIKVRVEDEDKDVKKTFWLEVKVDEGEAEIVNAWEN